MICQRSIIHKLVKVLCIARVYVRIAVMLWCRVYVNLLLSSDQIMIHNLMTE